MLRFAVPRVSRIRGRALGPALAALVIAGSAPRANAQSPGAAPGDGSTRPAGPPAAEPEDRPAVALLETGWANLDGARPADGRPDASTTERSLGAGVIWPGARGATTGFGVTVTDRQDANLSPLPGSGRRVGDLRAVDLMAFHSRPLARDRNFFGFLSLRGAAEDPGEVTDSLAGVLWAGRDRPFWPRTRLGWGVVAIYQTGEGLRAFPAPTFEWDPPGPLSVQLAGPRSEARYDLSDRWQLALGAQINLRRYRLTDGTLFADRQVPVRLSLRRQVRGQTAFEVFVGRLRGRSWEVTQRPGLPDTSLDVDGGRFVGFRVRLPLGVWR